MAQIKALLEVMALLRDPRKGCPWDLEQDFASIAPHTIEEAYEVDDAIRRQDYSALCDELGDLLFQVVFHARMAEEAGYFCFEDVVDGISEKMKRRHPHVFADADVADAAAQIENWEIIKAQERKATGDEVHPLNAIPISLPALTRAAKLYRRAKRAQLSSGAPAGDSVGERLFALVIEASEAGIDPEQALREVSEVFRRRALGEPSA